MQSLLKPIREFGNLMTLANDSLARFGCFGILVGLWVAAQAIAFRFLPRRLAVLSLVLSSLCLYRSAFPFQWGYQLPPFTDRLMEAPGQMFVSWGLAVLGIPIVMAGIWRLVGQRGTVLCVIVPVALTWLSPWHLRHHTRPAAHPFGPPGLPESALRHGRVYFELGRSEHSVSLLRLQFRRSACDARRPAGPHHQLSPRPVAGRRAGQCPLQRRPREHKVETRAVLQGHQRGYRSRAPIGDSARPARPDAAG